MKNITSTVTDELYNRIEAEHIIELPWWRKATIEEYIAGCLQTYFDKIDEARKNDEVFQDEQ